MIRSNRELRQSLSELRRGKSGRGAVNSPPKPRSNASLTNWTVDDRYALWIEGVIWILTAFLVIRPNAFNTGELVEYTVSPTARILKLSILGIGCLVVLWRMALARALLGTLNHFFLILYGLALVSVAWSITPSATIGQFLSLSVVVAACFAFALTGWREHRFQSTLRPGLTFLLLASLVVGVVAPDLALQNEEGGVSAGGAWRGLTFQKNVFGQLAGIGAILWAHAWMTRQSKPWMNVVGMGAAIACLLLSKSSTCLMATVIAIVLMALMLRAPNMRRYMRLILITFISFVILYALVILKIVPQLNILLEPVMALSGKDATFSNRSEIWAIINEHIQKSPLVGSGYGAYWIGPFAWSPSYEFVTRMYFYPTESHNGYLEIVNDLGFVGLLCLLGYLAVHMRQCLLLLKLDASQGALHLSLFCLLLIINLSESCWLSPNAPLSLIVMTLSTVSVARILLDRRLRATFGAPQRTL